MISSAFFALGVLLNSLWQAPLIALLTALALRYTRSTASTRYAVWLVAFIAACGVPIVTTALVLNHAAAHAPSQSRLIPPPTQNPVAHTTTSHAVVPPVEKPAVTHSTPASAPIHPYHPRLSVDQRVAMAVGAVWLAIFVFFLLRLAREIFALERLKRDALPLPFEYRETLRRWREVVHNRKDVRLCVSSETEVPIAVGLFDAMILLPDHLLATLAPDEIDQIALHELAHLRRADDWSNALERFGTTLFFFNPAIRWIASQLDLEREVACDDHVVAISSDVRTYAHCLTKMAEVTAWPHVPLAAPGVFVTRKSISIRIERLLKFGSNRRLSVSYTTALAAAVAAAIVFGCALTFGPVIASPVSATPAVASNTKSYKPVVHHTKPRLEKHAHAALPSPTPVPVEHQPLTLPSPPVHVAAMTPVTPRAVKPKALPAVLRTPSTPRAIAYAPKTTSPSLDSGAVRCDGCSFENVDWHGRDLRNIVMRGANLAGADLRNADLRGADLTGANLAGAHLEGARLNGTRLQGANFGDVSLRGVDLTGARIEGANISTTGADAQTMRVLLERCRGCNFAHIDARNMDLHGVKSVGINMDHADLRGADLRDAQFNGVNFDGVHFQGARLAGAAFIGCNFNGVDFRGVDLAGARLTGSNLSGAIMP